MRKNKIWILFVALFIFSSYSAGKNHLYKEYSIIPLPNERIKQSGKFTLQNEVKVSISTDSLSMHLFNYLTNILRNTTIKLKIVSENENASISFVTDSSIADEAYNLNISSNSFS